MELKVIKTEADYQNAIKMMEEIGDDPNFENNPDLVEKFELFETLIGLYEKEHYPIEKGNPIEIIKLKMNYMGLKQKDLVTYIGSKGVVSDVLNKKRKLSKKMIRVLSKILNIGQEILNTEYELATKCIKKNTKEKLIEKPNKAFHFLPSKWADICNYQKRMTQRRSIINVIPIV